MGGFMILYNLSVYFWARKLGLFYGLNTPINELRLNF
jgi:hypothetical protein